MSAYTYHDCCIQQNVSHGRNVLQHHTDSKWPDNLQSLMQILIFGQSDHILVMSALEVMQLVIRLTLWYPPGLTMSHIPILTTIPNED
jgi:hypothetical protein